MMNMQKLGINPAMMGGMGGYWENVIWRQNMKTKHLYKI